MLHGTKSNQTVYRSIDLGSLILQSCFLKNNVNLPLDSFSVLKMSYSQHWHITTVKYSSLSVPLPQTV